MSDLRERLLELCIDGACGSKTVRACQELAIAAARMALEDAAKIADQYARADHPTAVTVTDMAAHDIKSLAATITPGGGEG